MPLSFLTKNQQFVFVDPSATPPSTVNPEAVLPNHLYDIYLVVENTDTFEHIGVPVSVSHSAFGIGRMAGTDGLTQPAPVDVPPEAYGIPGTATIAFTFLTPPGGHGCLGAQIAPNVAYVGQNVTVVSCAQGAPSTLSFIVFGGAAAEAMLLTLIESVQGGSAIPPGSAQSWKPLLIAPPGTGPAAPTPAPVTLSLPPNAFDSVGLRVTIPPGATTTHVFSIVGTVAGQFEGEVDIVVKAVPPFPPPDPFVWGGVQSPDVLLFDFMNNPVPLGGQPGGPWDTLLAPNLNYKLSAVVHNDSATPAVNTVVRFWSLPLGLTSMGTLLDVRTVTVPGNGSVQVNSNVPYHSMPTGKHGCAAVSIYNSQSLSAPVDSTTPPYPGPSNQRSASAWRNTDSMFVFPGKPWNLVLGADAKAPLAVTATATLVAAGFERTPEVVNLRQALQQAGARTVYPLYLTPALQAKLPAADLKIQVGAARPVIATLTEKTTAAASEFAITGVVPADAKPGDVYLVLVSAKYADKTVQFLETLHVQAG